MKRIKTKRNFALLCLALSMPVAAAGDGGHFDVVQFIAQVLNFIIFFGGLSYILRKPIGSFFSNRLKGIKDALAMAEKSREDAKKKLDEIEEKMANLDSELADIGVQAKKDADREKERIHNQAKQEADKILAQAKSEVENIRREAVLSLKAYVADLAMVEAEKTISSSITDEERKKLFVAFTDRLGAKS